MKLKRFFMVIIVLAILMSGCTKGGSRYASKKARTEEKSLFSITEYKEKLYGERTDIKGYDKTYPEEVKSVKNGTSKKVNFEKCDFADFPDTEEASVLRLYSDGISVDESIRVIKERLKKIGQGDLDLEKELRDDSGQLAPDETKETPYYYPSVYEHKEKLKSGKGFMVNTNRCHIQMGEDGIYSMSDGTITKYLGLNTLAEHDSIGMNQENIVEQGTFGEMSGKSYELLSGKVSVLEASRIVNRFFEQGTPYPMEKDISIDIPRVEVFQLRDKYGYTFHMRRRFKNIPFSWISGAESRSGSEILDYLNEDFKQAYVVDNESVCAFAGYNEAEKIDIEEKQTKIICLKKAVEILEEKLAAHLRADIAEASFVYLPVLYSEEPQTEFAFPCWRFVGKDVSNGQKLCILLDALTGEITYYNFED